MTGTRCLHPVPSTTTPSTLFSRARPAVGTRWRRSSTISGGGISTHQPRDAKWRKLEMKIKGLLAGLGVAGKVALGVGVAAAATTGAGVAGVLPGPVQHAVSEAVHAVTPFSVPDPDHHSDRPVAGGDATTTT